MSPHLEADFTIHVPMFFFIWSILDFGQSGTFSVKIKPVFLDFSSIYTTKNFFTIWISARVLNLQLHNSQ